jgi:hypothetical protein
MMALRNRFMNDRSILNIVSVDSFDLVEIFGQHARGHQTRYARADHNGSPSECLCHELMPKADPGFRSAFCCITKAKFKCHSARLMSLNGPSRQAAFFGPTVANGALRTWLDLQLSPPSRSLTHNGSGTRIVRCPSSKFSTHLPTARPLTICRVAYLNLLEREPSRYAA